jgi:HK97 family phage portal protein
MKFKLPSFFNLKKSPERQIDAQRKYMAFSGGTSVNSDSAMEVSAFYRGVTYISTQIAKLPWEIKDKNNKILWDSRVMLLLDLAPNSEMTAFNFKTWLISQAIIKGNGYAEIERNILGEPVALWPIPSDYVMPQRNISTGELVYRVVAGGWQSQDIYLNPNDVFHVRNLYSRDGVMGQGLISYATTTLGISLGADNLANNLFANGGLPSGVLEVAGSLDDETYERLKESWKSQNAGRKSGGIAILEEGMKFNPISMAPDVLQFLDSRKFSVIEISRFLGLPPTKLFDSDSARYNNIEHANLEVATDTLDSWAKNLEQEADVKLLKYRFGGRHSELDLYAVFRGDMNTRATYFTKMMQSGSMTPNEIREKEGLAPYAGGDRFYIATNNFTPHDRIDEVIDSQVNKDTQTQDTPDPVDTAIANFLTSRITK